MLGFWGVSYYTCRGGSYLPTFAESCLVVTSGFLLETMPSKYVCGFCCSRVVSEARQVDVWEFPKIRGSIMDPK